MASLQNVLRRSVTKATEIRLLSEAKTAGLTSPSDIEDYASAHSPRRVKDLLGEEDVGRAVGGSPGGAGSRASLAGPTHWRELFGQPAALPGSRDHTTKGTPIAVEDSTTVGPVSHESPLGYVTRRGWGALSPRNAQSPSSRTPASPLPLLPPSPPPPGAHHQPCVFARVCVNGCGCVHASCVCRVQLPRQAAGVPACGGGTGRSHQPCGCSGAAGGKRRRGSSVVAGKRATGCVP